MLEWTDPEHEDIWLFATRITAELADRLRISRVPRGIKMVSSLLEYPEHDDKSDTNENNKNDRFAIFGLLILERLSQNNKNGYTYEDFAEILGNKDLIPKIVMFISYTAFKCTNIICQRKLIISALNVVKAFANAGGKIGALLRKELYESPILLGNISEVLDDSRSGPEVWEPAFDFNTKISMDIATRTEIGRIKMVMASWRSVGNADNGEHSKLFDIVDIYA